MSVTSSLDFAFRRGLDSGFRVADRQREAGWCRAVGRLQAIDDTGLKVFWPDCDSPTAGLRFRHNEG